MSTQSSLTDYFRVTKRPIDQHPAKRRKIDPDVCDLDECSKESSISSTTSIKDDHLFPDIAKLAQTPKSKKTEDLLKSYRNHKRDSFGKGITVSTPEQNDEEKQKKREAFNVGKSANKKLDFGHQSDAKNERQSRPRRSVARFSKKGSLSPHKEPKSVPSPEKKNVVFELKSALSPTKSKTSETLSKVNKNISNLTREEMKAKLGKVNKLSDLQDRLKAISKFKVQSSISPRKELPPKLSKKDISLEVVLPSSPSKQSPRKQHGSCPIKASPRKLNFEETIDELPQPTKDLNLPKKYRELADFFRTVDNLMALYSKSRDSVSLTQLRQGVEKATKRGFKLKNLKQIHCVFSTAYKFEWKKEVAGQGHTKLNYEINLQPSFNYGDIKCSQPGSKSLNPKELVARRKIFNGLLLRIAKEHHTKFLEELGIAIKDDILTSWHRDFDIESCPDIDEVEFPSQPESVAPKTVTDFINATNDIFGINKRLGQALSSQSEKEKLKSDAVKEEAVSKPEPSAIQIKKGLEKVPQAILDKILAKEKANQIKKMTENVVEKTERTLLKELLEIAPKVINCYKAESHRQSRKGLETKSFVTYCSKSNGRIKSDREMENLIRHFVKIAPEYFCFITIRKTEFIKETGKCKLEAEKAKLKLKQMLEEMK